MKIECFFFSFTLVQVFAGNTWMEDESLFQEASSRVASTEFPHYVVDLDLKPTDRWTQIGSNPAIRQYVPDIVNYLKSEVPAWLLPTLEKIGADIHAYFGPELAGEMEGLTAAMGPPLKLGDIVALNLVMQLESIGLNCSNWNTTGPTIPNDPGCMAVDPTQEWCYCHNKTEDVFIPGTDLLNKKITGPGACTSVVAQDENGHIWHGRNLDWNVPDPVRHVVSDIEYQRGGKTVFYATQPVGFVGVLNGLKRGVFSVSLNARGKGGKILANLEQALLHKSLTPSQHMRMVLESEDSSTFSKAVQMLAEGELIDECYYTTGGVNPGEGAVISRNRTRAADIWSMNSSETNGWYRLETNYDHWQPVPTADDRRTPGYANMNKMGPSGILADGSGLFNQVMTVWPTKNHHTDYTAIMSAGDATYTYRSYIWID